MLAIALLLAGCTTSVIENTETSSSHHSLSDVNRNPINLTVEVPCSEGCTVGRQFFLFLPFGKTVAETLEQSVYDTSYNSAVLAGFSPNLGDLPPSAPPLPTLKIEISSLSIHTYDLLVTRLVKGEVDIVFHLNSRPPLAINHTKSQSYSTPFSRELSHEFRKLLEEALRKGFEKMRGMRYS